MLDKTQKPETVISQSKGSFMAFVSTDYLPVVSVSFSKEKGVEPKEDLEVNIADFITVKGIKAQGNQLSPDKVKTIKPLASLPYDEPEPEDDPEQDEDTDEDPDEGVEDSDTLDESPEISKEEDDESTADNPEEDAPEGDVGDNGQISLF